MIAALIAVYAAAISVTPSLTGKAILAAPVLLGAPSLWAVFSERRWIAIFFFAALLLPPLPFALGDSGPHPALAIAALGFCAGFARLRQWRIDFAGPGLPLLALFGVLLASACLAAVYSGVIIAAGTVARVALFGIAVYLYFYVTSGPAHYSPADACRETRFLFAVACGSALFACLDFYFQFPAPAGYGPQFVWLDTGVYRRAQGVFYEASTLGNFCAFFLVMIAVALFRKGSWLPCSRKSLGAGAILFSAGLIFSYSRASMMNVLVALCVLAYLQGLRIRRSWLAGAGLFACGVLAVHFAFPQFAESYWLRLWYTAANMTSSPESALSGRVESWRTLLAFLTAHPLHWILGIGYKTLPYSDFIGRPVVADNMYLSILVETGLAGLGVFLAFNVAILRAARRAAASEDAQRSFFGRWIFCFWVGQLFQMLSGDLLTYWRVLPVYFWVLAMAVRDENSVSRSVQ